MHAIVLGNSGLICIEMRQRAELIFAVASLIEFPEAEGS